MAKKEHLLGRTSEKTAASAPECRLKLRIRGAVQGVGFRPFVYRLATELGLRGWVNNSPAGVFVEAEGARAALEQLLLRLEGEKPPRSFIQSLEASWLDPVGYGEFTIRPSETSGSKTALVLPDIATCPDCLREIFDPENRRFGYPFTNCTNCGPRFSIIEALPYDRANTSMARFRMCPRCQAEYDDPRDRRFHAQPNACPECGPHLELWDPQGKLISGPAAEGVPNQGCIPGALAATVEALRAGGIVAVKGLGGFHLMVAAHDRSAVERLRRLKHREEKPFALMFPSLASVKAACEVSPLEERLLRSPEAPIVLLRRLEASPGKPLPAPLVADIAPGNPNLGVMLPYTPLHHLLLSQLGSPVVATSGNLSDEPICISEQEALERLGGIAELFLVHNRPIVRHVDDSIVRVMLDRELVLRRARGFAPLPISLGPPEPSAGQDRSRPSVLGVGAHLKNTVALSVGSQVFVSQHIGDLETNQSFEAFRRVIRDFEQLYASPPAIIGADAHPDYLSSKFARDLTTKDSSRAAAGPSRSGSRLVSVQHHLAHVFSCMAENELTAPVLGVSWDGTGYGLDGTVWGGEFFHVTRDGWQRVAHLRNFRLPGGDQAVKEPRRTALGLLFEAYGDAAFDRQDLAPIRAFSAAELAALRTMLTRRFNSPLTSSAGRLFDAVAGLLGLRERVRFEGQAAMELEFALRPKQEHGAYAFALAPQPVSSSAAQECDAGVRVVLDWSPVLEAILADLKAQVAPAVIAGRFHNALAEAIVAVARQIRVERVVLTGGCFQNRYLTEQTVPRLVAAGFRPYWHQRIPPNDGGIALGQVAAALSELTPLEPLTP